jgi:hypothetical protein
MLCRIAFAWWIVLFLQEVGEEGAMQYFAAQQQFTSQQIVLSTSMTSPRCNSNSVWSLVWCT